MVYCLQGAYIFRTKVGESMNRPYIVCHMVTSVDGKVTGHFLESPRCEAATDIYYDIHRRYKAQGAGGFICGRVTMESSFTDGWYPDLSKYEPVERVCGHYMNHWMDEQSGYYAIAFDPKGKLGWKNAFIEDSDPGYDKAQIIEVLTEQVDGRYPAYLEDIGISYVFAGEDEIDVALALKILYDHLSPTCYLLEGGSIINGHFLRADCVDELSLVQAPMTADADSKPLFMNGDALGFDPVSVERNGDVLVTSYKKKATKD